MPSHSARTAPAGEPASSRNNGQGSRRGTKRKEDPAPQPRRSRQLSKVNEEEENRDPEVFPEKVGSYLMSVDVPAAKPSKSGEGLNPILLRKSMNNSGPVTLVRETPVRIQHRNLNL